MERMATEQPFQGQQGASRDSMRNQRLAGVLGAARREAAGARKQGRDQRLIRADRPDGRARQRSHAGRTWPSRSAAELSAVRTSRTSTSKGAVSVTRRATSTRSPAAGAAARATRYAPRRRRRARLRSTAPRICRLTANPTRRARPLALHNRTSAGRSIRAPCRNTAWKSVAPVSRSARRNPPVTCPLLTVRRSAAFAPLRGDASAPSGPPPSSFAHGSRAFSSVGACSVGTCAS